MDQILYVYVYIHVKSSCDATMCTCILFQFCFLFGVLGVSVAAYGRHLYNRINFTGNKLGQDIFDVALNGLPGDETASIYPL